MKKLLLVEHGYTDGIDYAFYDQNLIDGNDQLILYFNPVIIDSTRNNRFYWGYPWDITDLKMDKGDGHIRVLCSIDHDIKREGEITYSENQNLMPIVFFSGNPTQTNAEVRQIRNISWFDWLELKKTMSK